MILKFRKSGVIAIGILLLNLFVVSTLLAQTITTSAIVGSPFCSGSAVSVPYTITGSYTPGNIFTAQLSDGSGSFASPVTIGTLVSTVAGTIPGTIPVGASTGVAYRIRVVSNSPAVTGSDNGTDLTILTTPAINAMTATVCSGNGFSVTPVDGINGIVPAGTTYSWPAPVVTGGLTGGAASSGSPASITGTLTNPTNTTQTATYTVTPTSGSCTGGTFTVTVTVDPVPAITDMATTICSGSGFSETPVNGANGIVPAGTTYSWPAPVVTGGLTGGAASSGSPASITGTLTNPTNTAQTATYTVTPTSGSCTGGTFTVTVTVDPVPAITAHDSTICSGNGFSATPVNGANGIVPAGTTYSWPAPVVTGGLTGGAASSGSPTSITGTLTNPTNTAQTATYTVTPTSGSCTGRYLYSNGNS